ncbi:hypothetical protein O3M35_008494 [Rhynocoris fuscipes]|uniref:Protein kinase domain-containing protein n=1 Tax=Rhynocoris fuscipes TaxID=488301 RepID=A0AAW1D6I4_9HEMI
MIISKRNINIFNNVDIKNNRNKLILNRIINVPTNENQSKQKKSKFKYYKKRILNKNISSGKPEFGKTYNPVIITDWNFYLNVAKESFQKRYNYEGAFNVTFGNFHVLKLLAKGKYSRVLVVSKDSDNKLYALKVISLRKARKFNVLDQINNERSILSSIRFPFTLHIECLTRSESYLNYILPLLAGGDFFSFLKKNQLNELDVVFYAAQIVLALEYLHYLNIVYRDLKPENIMIDHLGYIKLTAFSLAKFIENNRTYTFCGTPEYLAPEILKNEGYGITCDWWALGCVIFEMCAGSLPFHCYDLTELYSKIIAGKFSCPGYFTSELKSLIRGLLKPDITQRLGNLHNGVNDIKNHVWFSKTSWMSLLNYTTKPPFVPAKEDLVSVVYYQQHRTMAEQSLAQYENTFDAYL